MSRPILNSIDTFNPLDGQIITFSYVGNKVVENTIIIRKLKDSDKVEPVYSNTQYTNLLQHKIPANVLKHGECYRAKIRIKDSANVYSSYSEEIIFYCFETPNIFFTNLSTDNGTEFRIETSSYITQLAYNYKSSGTYSDILSEYQVVVYHNSDCTREAFKSDVLYTNGNLTDLAAFVSDLENNKEYYFKAYGKTQYGMNIESNIVPVFIQYEKPYIYTVLNAQIIKDEASVLLTSNIISIMGKTDDDNLTYVKDDGTDYTNDDEKNGENGWVVLDKDNTGKTIIFDENIYVSDKYILQLRCRNIPLNTVFLTLHSLQGKTIGVKLKRSIVDTNKCYAEFLAETDTENLDYVTYSDLISGDVSNDILTQEVVIWIRKKYNAYEFKVFS